MIEETIQKFSSMLSYKYRCPKQWAYDAVVEAYSEIKESGKVVPEKAHGYWFKASKYKLFNKFDKQNRKPDQQVFEEWMVGVEPEEIDIVDDSDIFIKLSKKLSTREWRILSYLRKGMSLVTISEKEKWSQEYAWNRKEALLKRCQTILNLI